MLWAEIKRSKIKVYGEKSKIQHKENHTDDVLFLHNLLTNDIKGLKQGRFNYNLRLTGNGEPVDDFFVYKDKDFFIIDSSKKPQELIQELNRIKLSLKVYFEPLEYRHIIIFGEESGDFIKKLGTEPPEIFHFNKYQGVYISANPLRIGETAYEIFGDISVVQSLLENIKKADPEMLENLRIKNCIPKIGRELRKGFHPLEANILYAFSFEKGCYVGQEAVARVYFRGRTPRTAVLFRVDGDLSLDEKILMEGKPVGIITSLTSDKSYGIGYIFRNLAEKGKEFKTENGKIVILKECLFKF